MLLASGTAGGLSELPGRIRKLGCTPLAAVRMALGLAFEEDKLDTVPVGTSRSLGSLADALEVAQAVLAE